MSRQLGLRALNGVVSKLRREQGPWSLVFGLRIPQISSVFSMGTSSQPMGTGGDSGRSPAGCAWLVVGEGEEHTCTQVGFNLRLYMGIVIWWHVLRGPFYFPGSPDGEGQGCSFLPEDTLEGIPLRSSGGRGWWIVGGPCPLNVSSVFNVEGVSVSARNLPLKTWELNLKLSCFLGLNREPMGTLLASIARLLDFRSQN